MRSTILLYRSSNGDRWYLEEEFSGELAVLHFPTPSSGGQESRTPVRDFLKAGGRSPEQEALRHQLRKRYAGERDGAVSKVKRDCIL